ncbi:hypothetical protein D3C76_1270110 [compost metagenome]
MLNSFTVTTAVPPGTSEYNNSATSLAVNLGLQLISQTNKSNWLSLNLTLFAFFCRYVKFGELSKDGCNLAGSIAVTFNPRSSKNEVHPPGAAPISIAS